MSVSRLLNIPKVVLHEHIEGSITPQVALLLAKKHNVKMPANYIDGTNNSFYFDKSDFTSFITLYDFVASLIRDAEDYYLVTRDYLMRNAALGLCYCELIISPLHMGGMKNGGIDNVRYQHSLQAIKQAISEVNESTGLITRLHAVGVRHLGLAHITSVVTLVNNNPDELLTGFNIAGDERQNSFSKMAVLTSQSILQKSFHAGEICSSVSITKALDAGAMRIGHGIAAIDDVWLIKRLIENNVTLEVALSSNLLLIEKYRNGSHRHPIKKLYDAGVRISINTDDAGIFNTDIYKEYKIAKDTYGFEDYELLDISLCAVEAAFIGLDEKIKLIHHILSLFESDDIEKLRHAISTRVERCELNKRLSYRHMMLSTSAIRSDR